MLFNINDLVVELNDGTTAYVVEGGFSEDADAVMFEALELVGEPRIGADGSAAFFSTGRKGGPFTLKLLPNAPAIPWLQQRLEVIRRGGSIRWSGSVRDVRRNVSVTLRGGALRQGPLYPSYGAGDVSNHEYLFYFEEIIPDFDSAAAGAFAAVGSA